MSSGGQLLALEEAALSLGVSTKDLEQRIEKGELPEAEADDSGYLIAPEDLPVIAEREGWVIDLRTNPDSEPLNSEFAEMLKQLLTVGNQLTSEVSARMVAERSLEIQATQLDGAERKIDELHGVIEHQNTEYGRLAVDLDQVTIDLSVAKALADERRATIASLQQEAETARVRHHQDLSQRRVHQAALRAELDLARSDMSWWAKRRSIGKRSL